MSQFVCPSCKSQNIQRLSVIYENGLSRTSGTIGGIISNGNIGFLGEKFDATTQTAASERVAPPRRMGFFLPLIAIFVVFFILSSIVFSGIDNILFNPRSYSAAIIDIFIVGVLACVLILLWLAASVVYVKRAIRYNKTTWRTLKQTWNNSYQCNRCHRIFWLPPSP